MGLKTTCPARWFRPGLYRKYIGDRGVACRWVCFAMGESGSAEQETFASGSITGINNSNLRQLTMTQRTWS